jgi:hypothetical protein
MTFIHVGSKNENYSLWKVSQIELTFCNVKCLHFSGVKIAGLKSLKLIIFFLPWNRKEDCSVMVAKFLRSTLPLKTIKNGHQNKKQRGTET